MSRFDGHTPGSWRLMAGYTDREVGPDYVSPGYYENLVICGPDGQKVVGCDEYSVFSGPADIRLIAAAPDLLRQRDAAVALLREARGRIRFGRRNCAKVCHLCHQDCKGLLARIDALLKEVKP